MRLPAPVRRLAFRSAYRILQVFWFFRRPRKRGVKCLLTHADRIVLVRHTYGRRSWDLPGGAIKRGEPPVSAASREMREELGIQAADWSPVGAIRGSQDHRRDTIHCFRAELADLTLTLDPGEIASARWFAREQLPEDLGPYVLPIVARAP
ncbi:MAG: NUDIX domain-containing protein [Solirubrobacteraceae bacterium]